MVSKDSLREILGQNQESMLESKKNIQAVFDEIKKTFDAPYVWPYKVKDDGRRARGMHHLSRSDHFNQLDLLDHFFKPGNDPHHTARVVCTTHEEYVRDELIKQRRVLVMAINSFMAHVDAVIGMRKPKKKDRDDDGGE